MDKTRYISAGIVLLLIAAGVGVYFFTNQTAHPAMPPVPPVQGASSPQDATYTINGQAITLRNGVSIVDFASGSASKITTRYFGNAVTHDFNGDGRQDVAFLLTQNTGGSGTFYYVVAALNEARGYVGSQGLFLGDRIAPQTTEIGDGNVIVVNYADRKPGESFVTPTSVGKSIWLLLDPKTMQFSEVSQNFEGEADPSRMNLGMQTWHWVNTTYNDGVVVSPRAANVFTLTFKTDGTFSATTDCNSASGKYAASGAAISFNNIASTLMYCANSQEVDFTKILTQAQSYHFTSKGELIFDLKFDSGVSVFR